MHHSTTSISATALQDLLQKGCCLIDVREPIEHTEEHISGAKLIPLRELEKRISEINKDQALVVMCRSGKRGEEAQRKLDAMGIRGVQNLEGGILAWKQVGLPTVKTAKKILPLMQQVQITIGLGVLGGVILSKLVDPNWIYLSAFFGAGLIFAGSTGWCGLAILMSKMPWNRSPNHSCCSSGNCS